MGAVYSDNVPFAVDFGHSQIVYTFRYKNMNLEQMSKHSHVISTE